MAAFSFLKTFLSAFKPSSAKAGPALAEYYKQLPEPTYEDEERAIVDEEAAFQLSDWEKEELAQARLEERRPEIPLAQPISLEEGFLHHGQWLFRTRSHHVNAMKYDGETLTLTVQYDRGDTWTYDPINLTLAEKFAKDLMDGSPGTDVWSYLRWRPSEGAPDMVSHRSWINARKISGAAD